jgi:hypothetical protein
MKHLTLRIFCYTTAIRIKKYCFAIKCLYRFTVCIMSGQSSVHQCRDVIVGKYSLLVAQRF